ncbi:hypothetical protein K439DRAFT_207378 [Ramaria rubella]|nr:hypothetical protein K439DRAFT_207378 [Ramaria rubella]
MRCKYFLNGNCRKGDSCSFSHSNVEIVKKKLCKYFESGQCYKGDSCTFLHVTVPQLAREIMGYPGWFEPGSSSQLLTITCEADFDVSSEKLTQPRYAACLHARIIDDKYELLKFPIISKKPSMVECLLSLKEKISDIDFSDPKLYVGF